MTVLILLAQTKVNIVINNNVPGSLIYLNGKMVGITSSKGRAVIKVVPEGTHDVRIEKDGYESACKTITVSLLNNEFSFYLKKKTILKIKCNVPSAKLIIDGKPTGETDFMGKKTIELIPKGKHKLEIKKNGYSNVSETINVKEGENYYDFTLKGISTGKLLLRCNVLGAKVLIDKVVKGETVKGILSIEFPPGKHKVSIEKKGYETESKWVSIKKSGESTLFFELSKKKAEDPWALFVVIMLFILSFVLIILIILMRSSRSFGVMGKFELISIIGKGGIATIYKAKDRMRRKIVALKIMDYNLVRDADLVYKFFREGETISQINETFPNAPVVKVFDYGRDREKSLGVPYISMQLVKGNNLLKILREEKGLTVKRKLYIAREIVEGLIAAHKLNIFHGDITPDNIIIDGNKVTLIDFGIAMEEHDNYKNMDTSITGKPVYMSPEQCAGLPIDEKSDVYSLGIILFFMFHGTPPFIAKNPSEIMKMHQDCPLPRMDIRIPGDIKELIQQMLVKEPCKRPGTIELEKNLARLINQ